MKKLLVFVSVFFLITGITFSQNTENFVSTMDDAVKSLAAQIHAKLVEKNAAKITIGQFTFQNGATLFSSYWINQLTGELTNTQGRNYTIISTGATDAEWTITGDLVSIDNTIRVYTRLIRLSDRAIEGSFYSNFQRDESLNRMLAFSGGGMESGGSSGSGVDMYEPDSWESPVTYTIGSNQNATVMNRTLTQDDEDYFLLVPERSGRLTVETTGSIDTYMYLYDYDTDEELASNDDGGQGNNARIVQNVRGGTRYLAVVRGYSSSVTGSYGFRAYMIIREGDNSMDNPLSYEIGIGDDNITTVNRTLQEGDEDYFLLLPDRDGRLTIETTGRIDTYMELYDGAGDLLAEDDDSGNSSNARLRYNVRSGARYIAMIRGYNSSVRGSYGFRAYFPGGASLQPDSYEPDDDPSQAKVIEIGSSQQRTFHTGNDVDWVRFQVTIAGRYVIQARGENNNRLDTYIELYDSNMNAIAEDDDGGDSLSSLLALDLNSGDYYLKVWCLDEYPNQGYILSVEMN